MALHFPSKRDRWLGAVIWLAVFLVAAAIVSSALASRWIVAVALVIAAGGMLWIFYGTRYVVTDDEMIARSGPLRWSVPLDSITSVEPTSDPVASPACSLDRLEIRYDGGRKRILVSPIEKQAFRDALERSS